MRRSLISKTAEVNDVSIFERSGEVYSRILMKVNTRKYEWDYSLISIAWFKTLRRQMRAFEIESENVTTMKSLSTLLVIFWQCYSLPWEIISITWITTTEGCSVRSRGECLIAQQGDFFFLLWTGFINKRQPIFCELLWQVPPLFSHKLALAGDIYFRIFLLCFSSLFLIKNKTRKAISSWTYFQTMFTSWDFVRIKQLPGELEYITLKSELKTS